nr:VOC family protein [Halomarina salina]
MPLFPRLTVEDVAASADFYTDVLGFDELFAMPGGGTSHVRYRKYADVMLVQSGMAAEPGAVAESGTATESEATADGDDPPEVAGAGVEIYLTVEDGSVDDVAERVREAGFEAEGPTETPWNTREVSVEDPDGYVLVFSQQTADPEDLPWLEEGTVDGDAKTPADSDSPTDSD